MPYREEFGDGPGVGAHAILESQLARGALKDQFTELIGA